MPKAPTKFRPHWVPEASSSPMELRGTSTERGYKQQGWEEYSKWYRLQPENVECACGCGAESQCVDHIIASKPPDPSWMDMNNHQALTFACHNRKGARFDGLYGRPQDRSPEGLRILQKMRDAARERAGAINARLTGAAQ